MTTERFDAILLDTDNGPEALTLRTNDRLYDEDGLARLSKTLTPGGVAAFWSTYSDPAFVKRLQRAGFEAWTERVPARGGGKKRNHVIFMARKRSGAPDRSAAIDRKRIHGPTKKTDL